MASVAYALGILSEHYNLIVITSRIPSWEQVTREWLKSHFGDVFKGIYFAKGRQEGFTKSKGDICKEVGASWLIDDSPVHCASAADQGIKAILFGDYGWHHNAPTDLPRCKDWPAVVEFFDKQKI